MSQERVRFFTSYYGRRGLPLKRCLAITPVVPADYKGERAQQLAPTTTHMKQFSWMARDEWRAGYFGLLQQKTQPAKAAALVQGRIVLGHEVDPKRSFRGMLAEWLEFYGIPVACTEWGGETEDEMDQRALPFPDAPGGRLL